MVHAIRALPEEIRDARVDACVDSKVMIGAWEGQGGKTSLQLMQVTKQLFREVSSRNIQLSLQYVESNKNKSECSFTTVVSYRLEVIRGGFRGSRSCIWRGYRPLI